ncbi:DEAD-box ATP-dependent RNA helicase 16 [Lolium perenne]|uniref:DEAD-box ATP-dependent RNA helicase 16 n=1 Tax=Lolium perenne TaxID=4522 RepID=UPI0021E9F547|nr:DEAD-box ATP-dependent RNA helicase 16 [Lolium perenne]
MGKKQRRSRQQEEQVETPAAPHEDAPAAAAAAAAEEAAAQEVAVEGQTQTQGATNGGVKEEGKGEAAAEEEVKDVSFDELGLDEQLKRALRKKGLTNTTLIQREAIPRILEGTDLVAQAKTGSGKTFAYLLPLLQKLLRLSSEGTVRKSAPNALILVPTRELCQQVFNEASSLLQLCTSKLRIVQVNASMPDKDIKLALSGPPNILVTTPACVATCISKGIVQGSSIKESLSMMVLDEADLLLSYRCEDDLKALVPHIPRGCQSILMSATSSPDIVKLAKLLLHNPDILTLTEVGHVKDDVVPRNVQQFWISCSEKDKMLYILALLKLELIQKKVLIFVNSIDMAFRLRLFLEKFGIRSAVLNAELPQNSRLHIIEAFNARLFDYLIATDDNKTKEAKQTNKENKKDSRGRKHMQQTLDAEFGVVRGIDFKNVFTVVNFDMPPDPAGYIHRIGRTGRANKTGASISLVSPEEDDVFEEIENMLQDVEKKDTKCILPFPLLTTNAVESLRYRAQDVARSVTSRDIQEARRQDIKNEILNSDKLKAHFEENPTDLDLLKHDKILSNKAIPVHLRDVPEYLIDPTTKEASNAIKLSRAAMGVDNPGRKRKMGFRRGSGKSSDPLRTFSAEGKSRKRGGKERDGEQDRRKRRKKAEV